MAQAPDMAVENALWSGQLAHLGTLKCHHAAGIRRFRFPARSQPARSFVIPTTHDFGRSAAPIRQGLRGREFPGGVVAGRAAAPPADHGVLRVRADRRRHRRPRDAAARPTSSRTSIAWKQACSAATTTTPAGIALRAALAERNLSPQHAQDLLKAFRQDVTKHRYADWDELIDYCRYSAMPVGRFVLDVHGESRSTWPASDNVCAVLQIINHLQDCVKDYRALDRVYIPLDALDGGGRQRRGAGCAARDAAIARLPARACRPHRRHAGTGQPLAGTDQRPPACGWKSPPSSPWRGISCSCCGPGIR